MMAQLRPIEQRHDRYLSSTFLLVEHHLRSASYEECHFVLFKSDMPVARVHFEGDHHSAEIDARELIATALSLNADAIEVIHNHPSGNPAPSHEDILFTRKLYNIGAWLGLHLRDHVIVAAQGSFSFRDAGLI